MDMNLRKLSVIFTLLALAIPSRAQITINIRYTGKNGGARAGIVTMA